MHTEIAIVLVSVVTQTDVLFATANMQTAIVPMAEVHNILSSSEAMETQTPPTATTTAGVDDMDIVAFTTVNRHASLPKSGTRQHLVLVEPVISLDEVDAVVDIVPETTLADEPPPQQPPQKGFLRGKSSNQSKLRTKSKELMPTKAKRATSCAQFTVEAETMVTQ